MQVLRTTKDPGPNRSVARFVKEQSNFYLILKWRISDNGLKLHSLNFILPLYRACDYSQSLLIVRPLIRFGWKPQLPWWSSNRRNAEGLGAQKWHNYKQRSGVFPLPFYSPNHIDPFSTRVPWSRGLRSSRMWRRVTGYLVANCMSKSRAAIIEQRGDIFQKKGNLKCA